jgi:PAS domain S-box-containing protein
MDQLRRGVTVKWSRIPDDMIEEAAKEKEYAAKIGAKSGLNIPVRMGGSVICAITFTSIAAYRDWPDMMVARLRLVGEIFAAAIERKRADAALRKSEESYRDIFENAGEGIFQSTPDGRYIAANPALARMYGFASPEDLTRSLQDISRQVYVDPRRREEFKRQIEEQGAVRGFEHEVFRQDGSRFWISVNARVVRDEQGAILYYEGTAQDIAERKRAAEELEKANLQLRILSRQLFHIQEEERRHLARELHDEIGQTLTAAKINLEIIAPDVPAEIAGRLDDSVQLLDRLLRQVRELSLDLRPPLLDELGLVPTLRWLVDQQAQRAGLRVMFTTNVDRLEIDPDVRTACFRVAQEAITNVIRHSGARNVAIDLRCEVERLTLTVHDDGAGFDPAVIQQRTTQNFTLGLVSMKERALLVRGGFELRSAPGQGTEIRAWFPLPNDEHPSTMEPK